PNVSARYWRITFDCVIAIPLCSSTGTWPIRFLARYSGVRLAPAARSTCRYSKGMPIIASARPTLQDGTDKCNPFRTTVSDFFFFAADFGARPEVLLRIGAPRAARAADF